jgi:hypothetical protein
MVSENLMETTLGPRLYPSFTNSSKECKMGKLKLSANENRKLEYLQMLFALQFCAHTPKSRGQV